jgi:hypothetical protein
MLKTSLLVNKKMASFVDGFAVPEDNSTDNYSMRDVIGSKNDRAFSNASPSNGHDPSVVGHLRANYYHVHDSSRIYPRTDDDTPLASLTITGSATALTFGAWVEITNFDGKTVMSDVHHVILGNISDNDDYVLQLGTGTSGSQVFWGECAFTRDTNQVKGSQVPIQGPPINAGTKLWARLASTAGGSETVDIKVFSHQYPSVTGN